VGPANNKSAKKKPGPVLLKNENPGEGGCPDPAGESKVRVKEAATRRSGRKKLVPPATIGDLN